MDEKEDDIITIKIHQSQFDLLYSELLNTLFEGDVKQMVDVLYRTVRVPFRNKDGQLAIIILDRRRQKIIAAFHIKMRAGGNIQSIESIPLDLSSDGQILSDTFKVKHTEFPEALERARILLQNEHGELWTLIVVDFIQIAKLYSLLDFEPTKQLVGKVTKTALDHIKQGKIKLIPVPEVVNALERIV